jgi:hypothetical protein
MHVMCLLQVRVQLVVLMRGTLTHTSAFVGLLVACRGGSWPLVATCMHDTPS